MLTQLINKFKNKPSKTEVPHQPEIETINARLAKLEADLGKAISGYKLMLIKENPDILPEMINGENIDALDRSLETARALTVKIKEKLEAQSAAERVPAGAPPRSPPSLETLTSHEKIIHGLEKV